MKINSAILEFWKKGFFEKNRTTTEVRAKLLKDFGITCSNTSMQLTSCKKFLRKQNGGWIQKIRYSLQHTSSKKTDYFNLLDIDKDIKDVSEKLYLDGHNAQAIFEACKKLNNLVKGKVNFEDDGKSLMLKAFNEKKPFLKINELKNLTDINKQEGFKFMLAGIILFLRNPKAHENIVNNDSLLTIQYISHISILVKEVKKSSVSK